jgi:hypothetical protein
MRVELAAVQPDTLAHPRQSLAGAADVRRRAGALVGDFEDETVRLVADGDMRRDEPGVLDRVRQRLLHDPVGGAVDPVVQLAPLALDAQVDHQPGLAHLVDQCAEVGEAPLGREFGARLLVAQDPERATDLRERALAGVLDRLERLAGARGVVVEDAARALCLQHHQHHAMSDDVVQLARDPLALLARGRAGALVAFAVERLGAQPPSAASAAGEPRSEPDKPRREYKALDVDLT